MITKSEEFGNCGNKIHSNFGENAFDRMNIRGNYRIASMEYNALTGELTINQYPDVSKTIVLGDSSVSRNNSTSHKDVIEEILDWASMSIDDFNNLKKDKNYVIYNANNPESERYLYYTYSKATGEWVSSILVEGDEFFNTTDSIKYRYENNKLINTIDVLLTARNTVIDGKSTGITLEVSPTTGDSVHLDLVGEQYAGLMSPEDKYKLDNIGGKIGSVLELGNPTEGKVPLYLKSEDGQVLSIVNLDEDDYIDSIIASVATEDDPDNNIKVGDRILTFTITNGRKIVVSLEGWFLKYKGISTDSISVSIVGDNIGANVNLDPKGENLIKISKSGLLATLLWSPSIMREAPISVRFVKGEKVDYSTEIYAGYVYFATDTKEVIVDGIAYGLDLSSNSLELIKKIELGEVPGLLKVTNSNGKTYNISLPLATTSSNGLMSSLDKDKIETIERGAQVNIINGVKVGNIEQPISNKLVTLDTYSKSEINNKTFNSFKLKGVVDASGQLPSEHEIGDSYVVNQKVGMFLGALVYWNGESYEPFSGEIDLSNYATKKDLEDQSGSDISNIQRELDKKVDKIDGKGLSTNDYTTEEKRTLGNLSDFVTDVQENIIEGKINLDVAKKSVVNGVETIGHIVLKEASSTNNGLMSSKHYNVVESLQSSDNYLDKTGTPSSIWQLSKNNGPKIKNSGGEFGLRNSTDDDYTGLTVKNLTITGNVTQLGSSFITEAETVEVVDNTILLNKGEVGAGVTKGYAGIEIDRGTLPQYNIYFDESDDRFKVGQTGNEQPIMLRDNEINLVNGNTLIWDASTKLAKAGKNIDTELSKYLPLTGGTLSGDLSIGKASIRKDSGHLYTNGNFTLGGSSLSGVLTTTLSAANKGVIILSGGTIEKHVVDMGTQIYKVWSEDNDGAGSGLDADLLDGKHASEFALTTSIPTALKNPYAITFTGAVSDTYDGSAAKTVNIPVGLSLGETSATAYRGDRGKTAYDYAVGQRTIGEVSGLQGALDSKMLIGGTLPVGVDLNTISTAGSYRINEYINGPDINYVYGQLLVIRGASDTITQIISDINSTNIAWRSGNPEPLGHGAWGAWRSFWHAGNFDPDAKLSITDVIDDANTIQYSLIGRTHQDTANVPESGLGSFLVNYKWDGNAAHQMFFSYSSQRCFYRTKVENSGFSSWSRIAEMNDIPSSLPANGGNADTVGGLSAGSFLRNNNGDQAMNGNLELNTSQASYVRFNRNGIEKGYVGCGTHNSTDLYLNNYIGGNSIIVADDGKNYSNGNEIATTNQIPTLGNYVTLDTAQTITGTKTFSTAVTGRAGFYDTSDRRLKENIKPIELKPEKIKVYEFDKKERHSYGVIAQEVGELYPSVVQEGEDGYKTVNYNEVLIIKCTELEAENQILKDRLNRLEQLLIKKGIL